MLDIRRLRHETEAVKDALAKRDARLADLVDRVLEADVTRREALGVVNGLKARRNEASKRVGELKREGGDVEALILEMREVGDRISELDASIASADEEIEALLLGIPEHPIRGGSRRRWGPQRRPGLSWFTSDVRL